MHIARFIRAYVRSMRLYFAFITGIAGWIGVSFSDTQGIPPDAVLLGGAGEYELLFTVPAGVMAESPPLVAETGITVVGDAAAGAAGIVIQDNGRERRMERPPPCVRLESVAPIGSSPICAFLHVR